MATAPQPMHSALSVTIQDARVLIQPSASSTTGGVRTQPLHTLVMDLDSNRAEMQLMPRQGHSTMDVLAVMGMCKLHAGSALIVVTAAKPVAQLRGTDVYEVVEAQVLASTNASQNRANQALLKLLREAVDPHGAGRGLYFSYFYDLTHTAQRAALLASSDATWAAQPTSQRAEQHFMWNRAMAAPLLSAGAHRFVVPCILGFVQQLPGLTFQENGRGPQVKATVTLLARRAASRAGTRQWRRGADTEGYVANYAETEQLLTVDGPATHPAAGTTMSYVVVRGSIPLLWTQLPNMKYKPTTVIGPSQVSGAAHDKHFTSMVQQYNNVLAVNLINQGHGTEGKLEDAFRAEATRLIGSGSPIGQAMRYVAFDFHAECGQGKYHRLAVLWDQLAADFKVHGLFKHLNGQAAATQQGVVRVNCIDCLDRTNVVQGVLARKAVEVMLRELGLMPSGSTLTLPEAYPLVEKQFKIMWADHGDALSNQYAGTGAMKSGFTRTGKRTMGGMVDDGAKAVMRYYLNNYQDGRKQDAIDLLTGAYRCDTVNVPPIKPQPSPIMPMMLALLAVGLGAHNFGMALPYILGQTVPPAMAEADPDHLQQSQGMLHGARHLLSHVVFNPPLGSVSASIGRGLTSTPAADGPALHALIGAVLGYVILPVVLGLSLLVLLVQNGKHLVNKPQLCPNLAVTVQKPRTGESEKTKQH